MQNSHFSYNYGKHHGLIVKAKHFRKTAINFRRFLHLITHIDFAKLFKKAQ